MLFKNLRIGQEFDWRNGKRYSEHPYRCTKISARKYTDTKKATYKVGTINTKVFHVGN